MTFPLGRSGKTDSHKRMHAEGDGFDEDKLGKFIPKSDYEALREVKPTLPANCEGCFDELSGFVKVYVVDKDGQHAFCPVCATKEKVQSLL